MFSKRLIEIASFIPAHSSVIDVGCDHALLDIYLAINKDCNCIASDISENCIEKARVNVKKFKLEDEIKLVKSDGLKNIEHSEKDVVVIAGMGTDTILSILENCNANTIILQSNTELYELRANLSDKYTIEDEKVVFDNNIYYVIMKLKKGKKYYSYTDLLIGPVIRRRKTKIIKEYKNYLLNKYETIYDNISISSLLRTTIDKKLEVKSIIKKIQNSLK